MEIQVILSKVIGDQEEYGDLLGVRGKLKIDTGRATFFPNDRGDWLRMDRKRVTDSGDKITVSTRLGNKFVFRKT